MIVADESVLGFWCQELVFGNYLGVLQTTPDGGMQFTVRIRVYLDNKVHDSKDMRKGFQVNIKGQDIEKEITRVREFFKMLREAPVAVPGGDWEVLRDGRDFEVFMEEFRTMPGISTKKVAVQ